MEIGYQHTDWLLDRNYRESKAPFSHQFARGAPTVETRPLKPMLSTAGKLAMRSSRNCDRSAGGVKGDLVPRGARASQCSREGQWILHVRGGFFRSRRSQK